MYPIYHYEEGMELPSEGNFYLVAGNGLYLHKDNGLFRGFVQVDQVSCLDDVDEMFFQAHPTTTSLPPIPHDIVMKVKRFFAQVFAEHHAEACILLYYNDDEKKYAVLVPEQQVSHVAVIYKRPAAGPLADYRAIGTIHSHCDFGAFHSGTDDADESTFDGLHITFGHVNDPKGMTISASIVLNGQRTMVNPLGTLEGIVFDDPLHLILPPKEEVDFAAFQAEVDSWMEKVNRR